MREPKWGAAGDPKFLLAMGDRQLGAVIASRFITKHTSQPPTTVFVVYVGRDIGWMQHRNSIAQAEFDTLEEAMAFGMLIYKQHCDNI